MCKKSTPCSSLPPGTVEESSRQASWMHSKEEALALPCPHIAPLKTPSPAFATKGVAHRSRRSSLTDVITGAGDGSSADRRPLARHSVLPLLLGAQRPWRQRARLPGGSGRVRADCDREEAAGRKLQAQADETGLHLEREHLQPLLPAQGRQCVPRQELLQLHRPHQGRPGVPHVRRHRLPVHPQAGGGGIPGANLPRDHGRVAHGARRALRLGLLLQGGDQPGLRLLRRHRHAMAVLPGPEVLRPGPHPALLELQLRAGRRVRGVRRPGQSRAGGHRPRHLLQGGALVLDDSAGAQAFRARRDRWQVQAQRRRRRVAAARRLRPHHQHHQRRAGMRSREQPRRRHQLLPARPHRLPRALRANSRRQRRGQSGLHLPDALRRVTLMRDSSFVLWLKCCFSGVRLGFPLNGETHE